MAKKLGKDASVEELQELERLLADNPSYGLLEAIVGSLKGSPEHFERNIPEEELAGNGWRRLAGRLKEVVTMEDQRPDRMPRMWRWMAAAVVILAVAGTAVWYFRSDRDPSRMQYVDKMLNVGNGHRSKIILGDGTTVWLNAGSRLYYPDVFTGGKREVTLDGEGFFDVAKHEGMPFLVHAGKITIKVLGTRFNVKAYRDEPAVSTTLISGKVQVMMDGEPDKKIVLSPNEKLTVMNPVPETGATPDLVGNALHYQVQGVPKAGDDSLPETAWIENRLAFSNETFEEVARMLERRYDVQIDIADERLKEAHLSGVFEKETIGQVLDILQMTTKFKYSIEGKKVRLTPDL
ncbi:MAG TPA: FecR domain-containing protein [Puia sp.]|nr:FecR domain-containing protein [Puia sp.]